MKLGCHAVLFKEKIKSETEAILNGIAGTGFEGFEMGARFFGTDEKQGFNKLLNKYGLELSGMHVGCPLEDWIEKEDECLNKVMSVAEFIKDMPNKNIIMSGSDSKDLDFVTVAKNIDKAAKKCLDVGVKLNYHNHAWEFVNGAKIFNTLVQYAPNLYFGFDIGWVYKAGFDPMEIVKKHASRVSYVHLRDANNSEGNEFSELGEGIFDYAKIMSTLEEILGDNGWAIVEYEYGEPDFGRYKRAKDFLNR